MNELGVVDLFSGVGGFSLGAHLAGFRVLAAADKDPDLTASHADNFPDVPLLLTDIRKLRVKEILEKADVDAVEVAGVVGGPPCQGFSVIGSKKIDDPRNDLLGHFFRVVSELEPRFFVVENVPGLLHPPYRAKLEEATEQISGHYRLIGPRVLEASRFGAATSRPRMFLVGLSEDAAARAFERELDERTTSPATVADAFEGLPPLGAGKKDGRGDWWAPLPPVGPETPLGLYARTAQASPPDGLGSDFVRERHSKRLVSGYQKTRHTERVRKRFAAVEPGGKDEVSWYPKLRWDEPSPTLRAGTGPERGSYQAARPIHPDEPRVISVREAARIQGFPDWFLFHPAKWHSFRMIGNSVSPYPARTILETIRDVLSD